jgi:hypothetical protein
MFSNIDSSRSRRGYAPDFTQTSRAFASSLSRFHSNGLYQPEVRLVSTTPRKRAPYAHVLYAAAIAALLSACTQTSEPTAAAQPVEQVAVAPEVSTDAGMPEVVVVASRTMPEVVIVASRSKSDTQG